MLLIDGLLHEINNFKIVSSGLLHASSYLKNLSFVKSAKDYKNSMDANLPTRCKRKQVFIKISADKNATNRNKFEFI